jgi:hypothetical protein
VSKLLSKILLLLLCTIIIGADVYKDLAAESSCFFTLEKQKARRAFNRRPTVYNFDNVCNTRNENKRGVQKKTTKATTSNNPFSSLAKYHTQSTKSDLLLASKIPSSFSNSVDYYVFGLHKLTI